MVYIQNKDGRPLMPTMRNGKVRRMLKEGKAIVIDICPFTIRLTYDCANKTQEVIVGLDTGAINVGCSAVSEGRILYKSETELRTDISKKMTQRAKSRKNRRFRNTRYREARFDNRGQDGKLAPSLISKLNSTVKVVTELAKILPITKVIIEVAKFDIQKIKNPEITGVQYQQGEMFGYDNLRSFVLERDKYICQICKKQKGIFQIHHIKQRSQQGADSPDNLVTVHKTCHKEFHEGKIKHKFKMPRSYVPKTHVTILKDFIVRELNKHFQTEVTYGYITKKNRLRLNLEKTHFADAVAICNPESILEDRSFLHKRKCISRGRYQLTKGPRGNIKLPKGKLFGFSQGDKVKYKNTICFIKGRRSRGYFDIMNINNDSIHHTAKYGDLSKLLSKGSTMEVTILQFLQRDNSLFSLQKANE